MKAAFYPDVSLGLNKLGQLWGVPDQFWIEEECKYDIAAMYGISHWWFQRQRFYIDRFSSEGDRRAVRTHMRILSVIRIEVFSLYGYNYMKKIILCRADLKEDVIAERDFKYIYPSDFEDLYLLNLQGHLNHLSPDDKKVLTTAVNLWTRNLVIRQRVEDFQLGIESYQTQLNLTKPRWDATGFEFKHDYTVIDSPRAVTFRDRYGVQMIMRFNEIHKFSDGTLQQIDEALDYRVKEFRVNRTNPGMNTRFWTKKDVVRSKEFMFAIQKRLKTRRIFRNLESFVGGRIREGDYRVGSSICAKPFRIIDAHIKGERMVHVPMIPPEPEGSTQGQSTKHPSDTKVLTMKMEILLEPTLNKLLVGDMRDPLWIKLVTNGKQRWIKLWWKWRYLVLVESIHSPMLTLNVFNQRHHENRKTYNTAFATLIIEALVQKLIDEDNGRQNAILNLALQFENSYTAKDDLRKDYEKCNDISQDSRALINSFLKEGVDKDYELNLSMYGNAAKLEKLKDAKLAWLLDKYYHRSQESVGCSSSHAKLYLTEKELYQLHLDEEALRETIEEQEMDTKAREDKIRQKQDDDDDDEFFMEFGVMRIDSDYESSD
ncbi:hypothetical protein Tco_1145704 [Tanacetum coccineum]